MKIESVRTLGQPEKMRSWSLVEVRCANGLSGIGMTWAPAAAIHALVASPSTGMGRLIVGHDARDINRLMRRLNRDWQAERGRAGETGLALNAAGAIEQALWDLLGKATGQPLHRLLGGSHAPKIELYASGSAFNEEIFERERRLVPRTPEELIAMGRCYAQHGFKAFKFGWGNRFSAEDLATLRAVRQAVGPDVRMMIDFGCPAYHDDRWTVKQAIRTSERLAEVGIDFWEEPLAPRDFDGFKKLTEASPIRIATGESLTQPDDFDRLIDLRAADIIQPDIVQLGVSAFWRIAQRARDAGIGCVPHGPWGAPAVIGHAHLLGCLNLNPLVEYPAQFSYPSGSKRDVLLDFTHRRLFTQPLKVEGGCVHLPESPGLGLGDWVPDEIPSFEDFLANY